MTTAPFSPALGASFAPPVMEARKWLAETALPADRPLINVSQAAPVDPPPAKMRAHMADVIRDQADAHIYGPVLGLPALREEIAHRWTRAYGGTITEDHVAVTSGCNQAFCAAIASVAQAGDAVILPTPWYFNHKMWLDMVGVETQLLPCGAGMLPDVEAARQIITPKTRAIVLVTPNNPTGAEYPAGLIAAFGTLARETGLALIVDETYRDFHSLDGPPHDLFTDPDWADHLIHLYSFSKVFRLTGHRVGAMIASTQRLAEVEKFLDTVTICPNQLGQRAALFGLQHMGDWVAGERQEILRRRHAMQAGLSTLDGWTVLGTGAYFAYVAHSFSHPSDAIAKALLADQSVLLLPGTMFAPRRGEGGNGGAERQLRLAFANVDAEGIETLISRLRAFVPD